MRLSLNGKEKTTTTRLSFDGWAKMNRGVNRDTNGENGVQYGRRRALSRASKCGGGNDRTRRLSAHIAVQSAVQVRARGGSVEGGEFVAVGLGLVTEDGKAFGRSANAPRVARLQQLCESFNFAFVDRTLRLEEDLKNRRDVGGRVGYFL
jgi:hypothetical protein